MWEFLEELNIALTVPLTQAIIQVTILGISNVAFYTIVHEYLPQALYYTPLALVFGLFHSSILATSGDLVQFSLVTALYYAVSLHLSLFLNEVCKHNCETVLKTVVFFYALLCFRFCSDKDDFPEYVLTFIVMTIKLFCAAEEIEKQPWEENIRNHGLLVKNFTLFSYLIYTAWVPFKDFSNLRNKQHEKGERWYNMMVSAGSRAILFKVLSHKLIEATIVPDFWLKDQIFAIIQAFQYRCKYYYRAQIAELEVIAAGVKKGGWTKHYMFNFERSEFSIGIKDFLLGINIPLSTFIRNKFNTKDYEGHQTVLIHVVLLLILLTSYNIYIGSLLLWFLITIFSQRFALQIIVQVLDVCLFSCTTSFCYHRFGRRKEKFYIFKFFLIVLNHFRLSLLFVNLSTVSLAFAFKCTIAALIFDVILTILLLLTRKSEHSYFKLLNKK